MKIVLCMQNEYVLLLFVRINIKLQMKMGQKINKRRTASSTKNHGLLKVISLQNQQWFNGLQL